MISLAAQDSRAQQQILFPVVEQKDADGAGFFAGRNFKALGHLRSWMLQEQLTLARPFLRLFPRRGGRVPVPAGD